MASSNRGTEVSFLPCTVTFNMVEFDYTTLEHRLRELAFLNSGAKIVLRDERHADIKCEKFIYDGGMAAFVRYLDRSKTRADRADHDPLRKGRHRRRGRAVVERQLPRERALLHQQYSAARWRHALAGFRAALTRVINKYAEESGIAKKEKVDFRATTRAKA